jgi:2',3'-cyclic-nucleotide 2'-phosphodiesterase (5'-nucleotidase family)
MHDAVSRRSFLGYAAGLGGGLAIGRQAAAAQGRAKTISIFHTTDLHGHVLPTRTYEGLEDVGGLARCAACIRQWRQQCPDSITLDVGDLYQGTAVSHANRGRLMVDLLGRLGYDAWTLGNHDFDWGPEVLESHLAASRPGVITANLSRGGRPSGSLDGPWEAVRPWQIFEVGGFRVGIVGLVTPGLDAWLPRELLGGVTATDPVGSLIEAVAEARGQGAEAIVVTGHMGWKFQDDFANPVREMLRRAEGVDIYLAGHTHQNQPAWMLYDTLCTQASYHGIHCGRVDLTFDTASRRLVERRAFTVLMDDRFEPDPLVMRLAEPELAASATELARQVCTVAAVITARGRGCPLIRLLCEAFAGSLARHGTPVDGVFHGSFGTPAIPAGPLTVGDCWRLIPYENRLVTASLTGRQLASIVREDAGVRDSDRTLWPFDIGFDSQGELVRFRHRDEPADPAGRFTIALNSYDAQSGGRRLPKLRELLEQPEARRTLHALGTREALLEDLLGRGRVG